MDTQKDADYLREAAQMQLDISPRSGDEIQSRGSASRRRRRPWWRATRRFWTRSSAMEPVSPDE